MRLTHLTDIDVNQKSYQGQGQGRTFKCQGQDVRCLDIPRWLVDRILPWLLLFTLGKGDLLLLPLSTQQYLNGYPATGS